MTASRELAPEAYSAFVAKHAKWNFWANTLDLTFYTLAMSFIYTATVLSVYASRLTTSAVLLGFIPAIRNVGFFLPQLLLAQHSEEIPHKKSLVVKISVFERFPYLFVVLLIFLWPEAPNWLAFGTLALSLALATGSGGLASPAWKNMIAKVVPVDQRGRMYGLSQALGGLLGVGGAMLSRHFLVDYAYPTSFGLCFLLCFICQVFSYLALCLNREPYKTPTKPAVSTREYWRRLPSVLRENPNFARYLLSRTLIILGSMGGFFYIIYAQNRFDVGDGFAANLTIVALASQTVFTPAMGWLSDRLGNKWLTEISTAIAALGLGILLVAPSAGWFYAIFALMNASTSGLSVAAMTMTMEFGAEEDLPTYTALAGTVLATPVLVAPIIAGWITDVSGHQALFWVALAFTLAGWGAMHWLVREPRRLHQQPIPSTPTPDQPS